MPSQAVRIDTNSGFGAIRNMIWIRLTDKYANEDLSLLTEIISTKWLGACEQLAARIHVFPTRFSQLADDSIEPCQYPLAVSRDDS